MMENDLKIYLPRMDKNLLFERPSEFRIDKFKKLKYIESEKIMIATEDKVKPKTKISQKIA